MYYYQIEERRKRVIHVWIVWIIMIACLVAEIATYFHIHDALIQAGLFFIIGFSMLITLYVTNYITASYLANWIDSGSIGLITLLVIAGITYYFADLPLPPDKNILIVLAIIFLAFTPLIGILTLPLSVLFLYNRDKQPKAKMNLGRRI